MSSILTNSSAMVALQTLRGINQNLAKTQDMISTGKKIATAKDNAAIFAISKVMEADVKGFQSLSDSISLGEATVSVGANAAAQVQDLLGEIKKRVIAANEDNTDQAKLQDEIVSLREQVNTIVSSAQFNGLNLIDGSTTGFSVLSSLDRDSAGNVTTGQITLDTATTNLSATAGVDLDNFDGGGGGSAAVATVVAGTDQSATPGGRDNTGAQVIAAAATAEITFAGIVAGPQGGAATQDQATAANLAATNTIIAGDRVEVSLGSVRAAYTVRENDALADISSGIRSALIDAGVDTTVFDLDTNAAVLQITNDSGLEQQIEVSMTRGSGGLGSLNSIDVNGAGAATAIGTIEMLIDTAADAQAAMGTTARRLEIQNEFLSTQIDAFRNGIGALVDTNMEEASARLQALQVQQQLGVQALSIANQAPQTILALFR
ncbi:MAG: flagellin [Paracoccaceae bacterium]|jgi:flagellin|nr:flagellin [Paracoccaceae bacterium]